MTDSDGSPQHSQRVNWRGFLIHKFLVFILVAGSGWGFVHAGTSSAQEPASIATQPVQENHEGEAPAFTFKAITRMVIVEVVVRDTEDNPVRDVTARDLMVSESIDGSKEIPQTVASFQLVEGAVASTRAAHKGIVLSWLHKSFCPLNGAYELSYYLSPDSRKDGLHKIQVTSARRDLRLFFRPGYRIEADKPAEVGAGDFVAEASDSQLKKQQVLEVERKKHPELDLAAIACYDALDTTNFQLDVHKINSKKGDAFEFVVPGSYFASLPAAELGQARLLDFSFCTFQYSGRPIRHFEGTVRVTSNDNTLLTSRGFAQILTFEALQPRFSPDGRPIEPAQPPALSARLVVRDRGSRALGSGEVLLLTLSRDLFSVPIPEGQTNESFGSLSPENPAAMCGDVYQLAPWTTNLPHFSEIDATAPIYATSLGVYSRFFTAGIPGVTSRTEWFGVNYQGAFGVDQTGKYEFTLLSDDGAKVYIDDTLIVSDDTVHPVQRSRSKVLLEKGGHDIRVSYFQGPRTEVALVLLVKPPGRAWRLFDTKDFPLPGDSAAQRRKLPVPGE